VIASLALVTGDAGKK